jgi:RNA polymerase sigma factor (sigma-70 family)
MTALILTSQNMTLLDAARRGELVALDQLLRACKPDVRRYAQRYCLISLIDDAVQETLLVLVRKIHLLQSVAAFSSWMFKIVKRQCRRLGRMALRYDPWEDDKVDAWLASRPTSDIGLELVRAFDALPGHYREILLLRDFAGLTIKEIAQKTGLTIMATKSRLHRARELTREYLLS